MFKSFSGKTIITEDDVKNDKDKDIILEWYKYAKLARVDYDKRTGEWCERQDKLWATSADKTQPGWFTGDISYKKKWPMEIRVRGQKIYMKHLVKLAGAALTEKYISDLQISDKCLASLHIIHIPEISYNNSKYCRNYTKNATREFDECFGQDEFWDGVLSDCQGYYGDGDWHPDAG
jgi:hypothetical protein